MILVWLDEGSIEVQDNLELPQFDLEGVESVACVHQYKTGEYLTFPFTPIVNNLIFSSFVHLSKGFNEHSPSEFRFLLLILRLTAYWRGKFALFDKYA